MRRVAYLFSALALIAAVMPADAAFAGLGEPLPAEASGSATAGQVKAMLAKLTPEQAAALRQRLSSLHAPAGGDAFDELIGKLFLLFFLVLAVSLIIMAFSTASKDLRRDFR